MKKILFFLFLFIYSQIFAQLNPATKEYINSEIKDIAKLLKKGKIKPGYYVKGIDTTSTFLIDFKNSKKTNSHLFCVEVLTENSFNIIYPTDINYYSVNGKGYKKHSSRKNSFFIKELEIGKVKLYSRAKLPSNSKNLYYILFENEKNYLILDADAEDIEIVTLSSGSNGNSNGSATIGISSSGQNEKFKLFIKTYFSDCKSVVNMVRADLLTITDLQSIVSRYNKCSD